MAFKPSLTGAEMATAFVRALAVAASLTGALLWSGIASAATVDYDYDLNLSPYLGGTVGGTGTLIVQDKNGSDSVTTLDITMADNVKFDFTGQALANASASVDSHGNLTSLTGSDSSGEYSLSLYVLWNGDLGGTFSQGDWQNTFELISATDPPATPLPPAWTIMLIGMVAFSLLAYRGTKKDVARAVAA